MCCGVVMVCEVYGNVCATVVRAQQTERKSSGVRHAGKIRYGQRWDKQQRAAGRNAHMDRAIQRQLRVAQGSRARGQVEARRMRASTCKGGRPQTWQGVKSGRGRAGCAHNLNLGIESDARLIASCWMLKCLNQCYSRHQGPGWAAADAEPPLTPHAGCVDCTVVEQALDAAGRWSGCPPAGAMHTHWHMHTTGVRAGYILGVGSVSLGWSPAVDLAGARRVAR